MEKEHPPLIRVPVRIRAQDGKSGGTGTVTCARPSFRQRLGQAALIFVIGLVVGTLLLPVPLIHLFGVMFFLGMTGLAVRRLATRTVLRGAEGTCPSCQATGEFFVGMGGRRLRFPVKTSCPKCHVHLELDPVTPGAAA